MTFDVSFRAAIGCLALLICCSEVTAEDVPLIVDFRDGTVLRMVIPDHQLPWQRMSEEGEVTDQPLPLSDVKQLRFVVTTATEQVARVRRLITGLGSSSFQEREEAQAALQNLSKFKRIIEQAVPRVKDYEIRWRLAEIITHLKSKNEPTELLRNDYDQLTVAGDEEVEIHGDVGAWKVTAPYRGLNIALSRANVLSIRNDTIQLDLLAEPPLVNMERIVKDEDELFPPDITRVNFDRDPSGATIAPGTDASEIYVPWGVRFMSSFKDSYIAVEPFDVRGRSGGRCAANHKPLYQGSMTIRFCKPGNARLPAGVTHVGLWTAHIAPEGTALQAYDGRGRQIAEVKTIRNQRDFLALKTNVPIAYVRVVPDETIDPDFAIDDLVFDTPKPLSEAGEPDRYSIVLKSGERLQGSSLEVTGEELVLKELSIGYDEIRVPLADLAVLVPPHTVLPEVDAGKYCYLRTDDGSVLRAVQDGGLKLPRFPDLSIDANRLVALWGASALLEEPPEENWPKEGAVMIVGQDEYKTISAWSLGDTWLKAEIESLSDEPITYATSPMIWFRQPTKRPAECGLLRTATGEEIVLGVEDGYSLKQWSLEGVVIEKGGKEWSIGMGDIRSLLLPR